MEWTNATKDSDGFCFLQILLPYFILYTHIPGIQLETIQYNNIVKAWKTSKNLETNQ